MVLRLMLGTPKALLLRAGLCIGTGLTQAHDANISINNQPCTTDRLPNSASRSSVLTSYFLFLHNF